MGSAHYVFAYGSLAAGLDPAPTRERRAAGFVADLVGWARGWGVAMDNAREIPGYKRYAEPGGRCPEVFVCFLDVAERLGGRVNGVCLPVSRSRLRALDARERNYERRDVTAAIAGGGGAGAGPAAGAGAGEPVIWAYVGSPAGRARFAEGVARRTAVIQDAYLGAVGLAFAALGEREYAACRDSLDPGGLPVRALARREL